MSKNSTFEPRSLSGLISGDFTFLNVQSQDEEGKEHIYIDDEPMHTDQILEKPEATNQFFVDARHHLHRMKDVWYHDLLDAPYPDDGNDYEPRNNELLIYDAALTHPASGHVGYWRNTDKLTVTNVTVDTVYTDNIREKTPLNDIHVHNNVNMENTNISNVNTITSTRTNTTDIYTDNIHELTPATNINVHNNVNMQNTNIDNVNTITSTRTNTTDIYTDNIRELTPGGNVNINNIVNMSSNRITGLADPVSGTDAINKNFFDLQSIKGAITKKNCDFATTTTNIVLSGEQTIDGFLTNSSRVLVKDQTDARFNGIYITNPGSWTRSDDLDNAPSAEIFNGVWTTIKYGTVNAGFSYRISSQGTGPNELHQIGTDIITWDLSNINFTVQDPIIKTGDQISLNYTGNLKITGNSLDTIQDITTISNVQFASVTASGPNLMNTINNNGASNIVIENQLQDVIIRTPLTQRILLDSDLIEISSSVPVAAQTYTLGVNNLNQIVKHNPPVHSATYPIEIVTDDIRLRYVNTNLKLTGNDLNTIQDIDVTATPTFAGLNSTFNIEMNSKNINEVNLLELNGLKSIGGNSVPIISYHSLVPDLGGAVIDKNIGDSSNPWINGYVYTNWTEDIRNITPGTPINVLDELILTTNTGTPTHHLAIDSGGKVIKVLPSVLITADLDFYNLYDIINLVELNFSTTLGTKINYYGGIYFTEIQPSLLRTEVPTGGTHRWTVNNNHRFEITDTYLTCGAILRMNSIPIEFAPGYSIQSTGGEMKHESLIAHRININGVTKLFMDTSGLALNVGLYMGGQSVFWIGTDYYTQATPGLLNSEIPDGVHRWTVAGVNKFQISDGFITCGTTLQLNSNAIEYAPGYKIQAISGQMKYDTSGAHRFNVGGTTNFYTDAAYNVHDTGISHNFNIGGAQKFQVDSGGVAPSVPIYMGNNPIYWSSNVIYTDIQPNLLRTVLAAGNSKRFVINGATQLTISEGLTRNEGVFESVGNFYTSNIIGFGGTMNIWNNIQFINTPITGIPGYLCGLDGNLMVKYVSDKRIKKNIREMTYDELLPLIDVPIYKYQMKTHEEIQADKELQPEERQNDKVYNCVHCGHDTEQEIIGMVLDEEENYFKRGSLEEGYFPAYIEGIPILMGIVREQAKLIKSLSDRITILENR